jgi:hypothetical protein
LKQFLEFKTIEKNLNPLAQYWVETGLRLQPTGCGWLESRLGHGLAAQPSGENGLCGLCGLLQHGCAGAVTTRTGRRSGTLVGG